MRYAWLLLMFIVLPGCWSHQAARPREGVVAAIQDRDDAIWPARDTVRLRELMDRTPREVYTLRARDGLSAEALAEEDREVLKPTTEVVYKGVHARNLLRLTKKPEATGSAGRVGYVLTGFNPNGFLISSRTLENIERRRLIAAKLRPPVTQPKRSSPEELAKIKFELVDNTALHLEDGLPVCIPDPRDGWKGVLIHLQSLGANDYEPRVLEEFRRRGWAVIDIKPQSFIPSPIPEGWYEEIRSLRAEYQSLSAELFQAPPEPPHSTVRTPQDGTRTIRGSSRSRSASANSTAAGSRRATTWTTPGPRPRLRVRSTMAWPARRTRWSRFWTTSIPSGPICTGYPRQ